MRFAIFLLLSLCACAFADALEAGAAKIDITAPVGTPLSGYGARMGRNSTSVHDPVWARTLYLDDGETRLFLVSVDLIGIMPELRARVLELASDTVSPENIILTATHTHSAQGATTRNILIRFVSGRYIPEVLEQTAQGIVDSMRNAYDKRKRAALGYAVGAHEGLSVNRRYADGPIDEQIGVILVEDADGNPISIVTNFSAHPTSVGGEDFFSFSSDYPGFYYLEMEELLGPSCVPIFLNGAQGNQTTGNPEQKSGWERTESVGRSLARLAYKTAGYIMFGDVTLRVHYKEAALPATLLDILLPDRVFLQSLEINDLLINFFPGEACVELALEARRRALARGYEAQFSVGLANNHLMYFVPRHLYSDPTYESTSTFYGPGIEDWFYEQFESMMSRPVSRDDNKEQTEHKQPPVLLVHEIPNGVVVDLEGTPREIGIARGGEFLEDIQRLYEMRVVSKVDRGEWTPSSGMLRYIPSFLETKALMLPVLGMGSRVLLQELSLDLIREMEGMASGADLPFDAFWLLQHAPLYDLIEEKTALFAAPLCTMFAAVGERAGADELIVGRNLDWALPEQNVITRTRPTSGNAFMQAGFPWNAGVFTCMNETGLTVCVERVQTSGITRPDKAPIEFILRDIMQFSDDYNTALNRLRRSAHISGVHVLLAGFVEDEPRAAIVEFGKEIVVREEKNGLLLGVLPDNTVADEFTIGRYATIQSFFADMRIIGDLDAQRVLTSFDAASRETVSLGDVWNDHTRHSVVLLPKFRRMNLALPDNDGNPGDFLTIPLTGELFHE